jgi:pilus assembly protein Flp/PilA
MLQKFFAKMSDEKGQGLVEYALILVLISIVCIVALGAIGTNANSVYESIRDALVPAGAGTGT